MNSRNIELLAPAGDLEKLRFALHYGADAVYFSGSSYGLRAFAGNFTQEEIIEAVELCHSLGKKAYVTVNSYPHNHELHGLEAYLQFLEKANVDALIVADPGIFMLCQETIPNMKIHISTQATLVNWAGVKFWESFPSVERAVLARELSHQEIREIYDRTAIELEVFIHGAICMSYSGRCLLSHYLTGRDANRGACAQPCRWQYSLVESKRPNEYFPIEEDQSGTYIFNSEDLCLANHLDMVVNTGASSLKIEGRMKSAYYVATVTRSYRALLDGLHTMNDDEKKYWIDELYKISHRAYTPGLFLQGKESRSISDLDPGYIMDYDFIGVVKEYDSETNTAIVEQRNKFSIGDYIEIISPGKLHTETTIQSIERQISDDTWEAIESANRAQEYVKINIPFEVKPFDILRKRKTALD